MLHRVFSFCYIPFFVDLTLLLLLILLILLLRVRWTQAPQLLPDSDQYVVVKDKTADYFMHSDTGDLITVKVSISSHFNPARRSCVLSITFVHRRWFPSS